MKKIFIIFVLLWGCAKEEVNPEVNVIGRYMGINEDGWSAPLIIKSDEVIFNDVWIDDQFIVESDSLFFDVQHKHVIWHYKLKIITDGLRGNHYRTTTFEPSKIHQPGTIKFIKQ